MAEYGGDTNQSMEYSEREEYQSAEHSEEQQEDQSVDYEEQPQAPSGNNRQPSPQNRPQGKALQKRGLPSYQPQDTAQNKHPQTQRYPTSQPQAGPMTRTGQQTPSQSDEVDPYYKPMMGPHGHYIHASHLPHGTHQEGMEALTAIYGEKFLYQQWSSILANRGLAKQNTAGIHRTRKLWGMF